MSFKFETLVKCPVCNSEKISESFKKYDTFLSHDFSVYSCHNCKLLFVNPRISAAHPGELYNENYFSGDNWDEDTDYHSNYKNPKRSAQLQKMYQEHYEQIKVITRKSNPKILDVVAGLGFFGQNVVKINPDANILCIDFSQHAVDHMSSMGLKSKKMDILEIEDEKFDAVYMREVIEHLYEPQKIVEKIFTLLNTGGVFYYTTGNTDEVMDMTKWGNVRPVGHLNYFNFSSSSLLLKSAGFEIQRREIAVRSFSKIVKGFLKICLSFCNLRPKELPIGVKR